MLVILPSEHSLPPKVNMDLLQQLQTVVAPDIFTPPVVQVTG